MPYGFEQSAARAKAEIDDALGQRVRPLGPVPNQQPMQLPGNPQLTPQGMSFSAQQPMGGGMLSGGMTVDPRLKLAQLQAQYQHGPFSAGVQYQPGGGVSGNVGFRQAFQEGGLATSVHMPQDFHERDIDFINTRNQHMREMVGKAAYAKGGSVSAGMSDEELAREFSSNQNNAAIIAEVNRRIEDKLMRRFGGDKVAARAFLKSTNDPMAILVEGYAKGGGVWTRKEGQNPEGGLNAAGRASLKAQGHDIKPPVSAKMAAKSPKAAARRKSFCARMSGMEGPMKDEKGKPTRKALALRKWDC